MRSQQSRTRKYKTRLLPEVSLTPLIDTALTLLIIFMVTTPILKHENALQIELPKGKIQEINENKLQEIIITLDKHGKLFLNHTMTSETTLKSSLQEIIGKQQNKTVFVKADTETSYGKVIELVDQIKQIEGISYVALATTKIN